MGISLCMPPVSRAARAVVPPVSRAPCIFSSSMGLSLCVSPAPPSTSVEPPLSTIPPPPTLAVITSLLPSAAIAVGVSELPPISIK
eukprot:5672402-Pyramimonas_sp.AAC.1